MKSHKEEALLLPAVLWVSDKRRSKRRKVH